MRASLLAFLVLVAVVVAGAISVDADYIRYYYGSRDCSSSDSRMYVLGSSASCFSYNSTYTVATESAILSKCNQSSGKFSYISYKGTGCSGSVRNSFVDANESSCQGLASDDTTTGSMKVYCAGASTVASFSAVLIIASVLSLLL